MRKALTPMGMDIAIRIPILMGTVTATDIRTHIPPGEDTAIVVHADRAVTEAGVVAVENAGGLTAAIEFGRSSRAARTCPRSASGTFDGQHGV